MQLTSIFVSPSHWAVDQVLIQAFPPPGGPIQCDHLVIGTSDAAAATGHPIIAEEAERTYVVAYNESYRSYGSKCCSM